MLIMCNRTISRVYELFFMCYCIGVAFVCLYFDCMLYVYCGMSSEFVNLMLVMCNRIIS